jgi:hypothetical protein
MPYVVRDAAILKDQDGAAVLRAHHCR